MKRFLAVLSVGALAALVAPTTAHAQSIRDIPEAGDAICDGIATFIDEAAGGGAPAELTDGLQQIHDAVCSGGEDPPDEGDGGESAGPHCDVFTEVISGLGGAGAPAELTDGIQSIADGAGCTADDGGGDGNDTTTTTTAPTGDDDDDDEGDDTEVAGETETAGTGTGGGTALPATGGGLIAGGAGLGLLGLAALGRRFFGTT